MWNGWRKTLNDFGVKRKLPMSAAVRAITRYEFQPAAGIQGKQNCKFIR